MNTRGFLHVKRLVVGEKRRHDSTAETISAPFPAETMNTVPAIVAMGLSSFLYLYGQVACRLLSSMLPFLLLRVFELAVTMTVTGACIKFHKKSSLQVGRASRMGQRVEGPRHSWVPIIFGAGLYW